MKDIFIDLTYNLDEDNFKISTNVKEEKITDLLSTFIMTQIGQGVDNRKSKENSVYNIHIELDMTTDTFTVSHNCGNNGLRDGIIVRYISKMMEGD